MLIENYSAVRNNLKSFCDRVALGQEDLIITRTYHEDVVMISLERYAKILELERALKAIEEK